MLTRFSRNGARRMPQRIIALSHSREGHSDWAVLCKGYTHLWYTINDNLLRAGRKLSASPAVTVFVNVKLYFHLPRKYIKDSFAVMILIALNPSSLLLPSPMVPYNRFIIAWLAILFGFLNSAHGCKQHAVESVASASSSSSSDSNRLIAYVTDWVRFSLYMLILR